MEPYLKNPSLLIPSKEARHRFTTKIKTAFDTLRTINPAAVKKAFYYLKRGEIGFLLRRIDAKLRRHSRLQTAYTAIDPKVFFEMFDPARFVLPKPIDIVIPVYNGYDYLEKLFDTLEANTTSPYRLVVVNDAGDDEQVLPFLKERLQRFDNAVLIENRENIGFVRSVLKALEKVNSHFVILNTDTELPPYWLERLMYPIFHTPNVASTTPFTNAGTIASFPRFLEDNPIFENLDEVTLDKAFRHIKPTIHDAEAPTGVGFCMGVNYDVVERIGFFDPEAFGKGYGEENDWCQRAIQAGYVNLIIPNLFVYHKHGGSFPSEVKQKLIEENHKKLLQRYPGYDKEVQTYIAKDPHRTIREVLVLTASTLSRKAVLVFDHGLGGGANRYIDEKIRDMVSARKNTILIRYDFYGKRFLLEHRYKTYKHYFALENLEAIDYLLKFVNIKSIFLNSLVAYPYPQEMLEYLDDYLKKHSDVKLTVPVHDYYCICPSYTLLNDKGIYCGVPKDIGECRKCMQNNTQEWNTFHTEVVDIDRWRELWQALLDRSEKILCFSRSSAEILSRAYPTLMMEKLSIEPHEVCDIEPLQMPSKRTDEPKVIGVLGAINYAKGAAVVKELVALIEAENLPYRVVVIGEITERIDSDRFEMTGKYKREKLPQLIRRYGVDLFVIPSICPETFSYTTEEIIQMQMPLFVFDIGAPAERVRAYEKGTVVSEINASALLSRIKEKL